MSGNLGAPTKTEDFGALAETVLRACARMAEFTEKPGEITRTFLSPPMHEAHEFLGGWMRRVGMEVRVDAMGNLRGVHAGAAAKADSGRLLLGSHIDTVPNAGAYDGVLGVALAIALVEWLDGRRLGYGIEVVAFSEEEGVRFAAPFLGSSALVGDASDEMLAARDKNGVSVAQAIAAFGLDAGRMAEAELRGDMLGYIEFHIEQGPVLEDLGRSLGVVERIVGQSRLRAEFTGAANHAGTTPMRLRRDALAGAAEWIVAVEREANATEGLVATVGRIEAKPGAGNVIAGRASLSLDVRHADDEARRRVVDGMLAAAREICARRRLEFDATLLLDQAAVAMDAGLTAVLERAAKAAGGTAHRMSSGAGHDAMVMARRIPSAMLFLRSPGGVSHHPDESVLGEDVAAALAVGARMLALLDEECGAGTSSR